MSPDEVAKIHILNYVDTLNRWVRPEQRGFVFRFEPDATYGPSIVATPPSERAEGYYILSGENLVELEGVARGMLHLAVLIARGNVKVKESR